MEKNKTVQGEHFGGVAMTKLKCEDIPKLLMLIRVNFENAYNFKSEDEAKLLVEYWYECLKVYPREVVYKAFDNAIKSSEFAPKIATILSEVNKLVEANGKTDEELWAELCRVKYEAYDASLSCNPQYSVETQKEGKKRLDAVWRNLSPEIMLYVVDEIGLARIGAMDDEALQYEKTQFFKSMSRLRVKLRTREEVKNLFKLTGAIDLPLLSDKKD